MILLTFIVSVSVSAKKKKKSLQASSCYEIIIFFHQGILYVIEISTEIIGKKIYYIRAIYIIILL
jgi:hypothetical protein